MSTAARVPAWKRLGLKLGGGDQATASPASSVPTPASSSISSSAVKRKVSYSAPTSDQQQQSAKKSKLDFQASSDSTTTTPSKRAKTVSFASETASSSTSAAAPTSARFAPSSAEQGPEGKDIIRNKPKQKQQPPAPKKSTAIAAAAEKKSSGPAPPINLGPALEYLRKWHGSRDTWKFNKNHQTKLLEQVFAEETTIPAADIDIFYEYIRPLKGHVRQRLRELANGVITRDTEVGVKGFPSTMANNKKDAAKKQDEYEKVVETFLAKEKPAPGQGKPRFQEVDYVLRTADMEMQRRVVKRMRAQVVLDELADGTDDASAVQATNGSEGSTTHAAGGDSLATRASLNDGSQQRVKRKRKTRTAVVDEYDSSSSEDDSSSDKSSDDDEAEGGAATKTKQQKAVAKAKDDSSSDSDSSSDDDSDSDSD